MSDRWSFQVQVKPGTWGGPKIETMQAELNRMGAPGWELVKTVVPAPSAPAIIVFKRPQ